ncbi:MAG: GNAT family N-acetyltransferase [Rhodospirillaceae bacterium]|nr:GNAT family N-acetyltransferase [Rhodospirillaceae bacterium]
MPKVESKKTAGFKIEQIFPGNELFADIGKVLIATEAMRDSVGVWWNVVEAECSSGQRQLFASRLGRMIAGYMLLKSRDAKISTLYVAPEFRNQGIGEALYGMGVVNLGTPYPYTVFLHDVRGEFTRIIKANSLVMDDSGPLCVLNPGNDDEWANKKAATKLAPAAQPSAAPVRQTPFSRPPSAPSRVRLVS